jgi:hypothetical protein
MATRKTYYLTIAGQETTSLEVALDASELDLVTRLVMALNEAASEDAPRASLEVDSPRYQVDEIVSVPRA